MTEEYTSDRHDSPNRLYRDPHKGKLLGVCAGLADYFGIDSWIVRLGAIIGLLLFTVPTLVAYFVAGALLPRKPEHLYRDRKEEAFWRGVRTEPVQTVHDLGLRFQDLDRRLRAIEAYVTSREFELNRQINDLDR